MDDADQADIAVVYFAGHGIEVSGNNYVIPVDARLEREYDAKDEAVDLERIFEALDKVKRLRLVILDACRDNPYQKKMKRRVASRGAVSRGLGAIEVMESDTLVAYAAKPGSTAEDGADGHSPYAKALLKYLPEPGLDVRFAFGKVKDEVMRSTRSSQEPVVYGSLGGDPIALIPPKPEPKVALPVVAGSTQDMLHSSTGGFHETEIRGGAILGQGQRIR
jgi:uncharacterized caspase-like protein